VVPPDIGVAGDEGAKPTWRFLLDESANYQIAPHLRHLGHDVTAVGQDYPASLKDVDILAIARREQRIVITNDRDFGELVVREAAPHAGVILLRLGAVTTDELIARLDEVFAQHGHFMGELLIVSRKRVRIRCTGV
jgi:predicted nuclease of predicted toxin-antitoxin system